MLGIYAFVVHVWWVSLPLVVGMFPSHWSDNDNVLVYYADETEMNTGASMVKWTKKML